MGIGLELARAMNGHARGSASVFRHRGITVTTGSPSGRYGLALGQPGRRSSLLLHRPARVRTAWEKGCLVAIGASWLCGRWSNRVAFTDDPTTPNTILCSRCAEAERAKDRQELVDAVRAGAVRVPW